MPGVTLLLLAGSFSFGGPTREPSGDRWLARDKAWHFGASMVLQSATHSILRANGHEYRDAAWTAAGVTLSLGVAKEWWDSRGHGDPSWKDLGADAAGTGTGAVVMRQLVP